MRIDPDNCRDPDLLAAEVRRLQSVIAARVPALSDEEMDAVREAAESFEFDDQDEECARIAATLRSLMERSQDASTVART